MISSCSRDASTAFRLLSVTDCGSRRAPAMFVRPIPRRDVPEAPPHLLRSSLPMCKRLLACAVSILLVQAAPAWAQQPPSTDTGAPAYQLDPVLGPLLDDSLFSSADVGVQVVDVETGDEVWAYNADADMLPASVNKVLTTAVALRTLGPAWDFTTDLLSTGDVDADGVLHGDLYVRGGGDPTLVVEQLWKIIRDLQSGGVNEIDGSIYFDDSFFSDPGPVPGWNKGVDEANGPAYFAPLGALTVDFNTTCLVIAPGSEKGQPALVGLETPASVIEVDDQAVTGSVGSHLWLKVEREVSDDGANVTFTVNGSVPMDAKPIHLYRAVGDPTAHFQAVFVDLLKERGVTFTGRLRRGVTPDDAVVLVRHRSDPLAMILAQMNKRSSNIMAEQVLKAVGAVATGGHGSTAAGLDALRAYLDGLGISRDEYHVVNGSGLSRETRVRPSLITAVLTDMARDRRIGPEFMASLALAGVDGTLRRRLQGDDAGLLRGKTGSLDHVFCLAGYAQGGDGHVYAFAFLANGFRGSTSPVRKLQDRFAEALLENGADVGHGSP